MRKINVRKTVVLCSMSLGFAVTTVAFQNFARFEPFKAPDTSDLFLGGGLSMALKTAKKEPTPSKVALNTDSAQTENPQKKDSKAAKTTAEPSTPEEK